MLIVYNRSAAIIVLTSLLAIMPVFLVTQSLSLSILTIAGIWLGGSRWWRSRPTPDGVKRPYPAVYFIPLPVLSIPLALFGVFGFFVEKGMSKPASRAGARARAGVDLRNRPPDAIAPAPTAQRVAKPAPERAPRPKPQNPIDRAIADLNDGDRASKLKAFSEIRYPRKSDPRRAEIVAALKSTLLADDTLPYGEGMRLLVAWGEPEEILPVLVIRAAEGPAHLRHEAIAYLGKIRDPRSVEAVAARFKDRGDQFAAETALKQQGEAAAPTLIGLLADPDPDVRSRTYRLLGETGGPDALKAIEEKTDEADPQARDAATSAALQIRGRLGMATGGRRARP